MHKVDGDRPLDCETHVLKRQLILALLLGQFAAGPVSAKMPSAALAGASAPSWVIDPGHSAAKPCPKSANEATGAQYFALAQGSALGPSFACAESGPYSWRDGRMWFVQKIEDLLPPSCPHLQPICHIDLIRVCSLTAANDKLTPAGAAAGPAGCAIYRPSVRILAGK